MDWADERQEIKDGNGHATATNVSVEINPWKWVEYNIVKVV